MIPPPKDKAKELFNKMYNCELGISYYASKQCALIAVNEIISKDVLYSFSEKHKYWNEVKTEIEKL
jgi:hypothetical protein